jgi:hypothetical protein
MTAPLRGHASAWVTGLACAAALVPLAIFARQIAARDYQPGASYKPRLEAVLKASRIGARGGPFATVRQGDRFTLAPGLFNDLGMAAVSDLWGRLSGRPITEGQLASINLGVMAVALLGLVLVMPAAFRPALAVLFVTVPVAVREYRSPDSVAIHGALAVIGLALAIAPTRGWPPWVGVPIGTLLFVVHKIRSPYGLFAAAAMVAVLLVLARWDRSPRPLRTALLATLTFAVLSIPWHLALERRARDPRVVDPEALRFHGVFNSLVSGVGWTANRWGIEPWDPKIVAFLADRSGGAPVGLQSLEGERRAREAYGSLWREAPGHLLSVYLSRVPGAVRDYVWLGAFGALFWVAAGSWAFREAWRARQGATLALLVAPAIIALGLLSQIVLIDPRLLYSYPLRFVSALGMLTALNAVLLEARFSVPIRSMVRPARATSAQ